MQSAYIELEDSIFRDPGVLNHVFNINATDIDTVFEKVSQTFNVNKPEWGVEKNRRSWNLDEELEQSWYEPLVWFQNHIADAIEETIHLDPACIFGKLKFRVWDRPLKEGIKAKELGNPSALEPDIIHHLSSTSRTELSWRDVLLVEEVKSDLQAAILQASIYVRCLFAAHEEWFCVPTIIFEYRNAAFYLLLHTRSGIIATSPMCLRTNEGLREIVKMLICLTRWTPSTAFVDRSRSLTRFWFEDLGQFRIKEIICRRTNLVGPSTRAYTLAQVTGKKSSESESGVISPAEVDTKKPHTRTRENGVETDYHVTPHHVSPQTVPDIVHSRKRNSPSDSSKESIHSLPPRRTTRSLAKQQFGLASQVLQNEVSAPNLGIAAPTEWSLVQRVDDGADLHPLRIVDLLEHKGPYSELIYKLSTPIDTRCAEGEIFKPLRNEFGVPHVIAGFEVRNQEDRVVETAAFLSSKAEFWNILLSAEDQQREWTSQFINRKLYALLMTTVGMPLTKAPTVVHLLEGLLHAMLGHYVLYQSGWLHRDVSTGNVLLLKKPEARSQKSVSDIIPSGVTLGDCQGIIIDGDHAVRWKEAREDPGDIRSGTLPFLSMRLLATWSRALPCRHTAIDDLESFLWVFIASVFECRRMRKRSTETEDELYLALHDTDLSKLYLHKVALVAFLREEISWATVLKHESEVLVFAAVIDLIEEWYQLSISYAKKLNAFFGVDEDSTVDVQAVYAQLCEEAYVDYFRVGFGKLAELKAKPVESLADW